MCHVERERCGYGTAELIWLADSIDAGRTQRHAILLVKYPADNLAIRLVTPETSSTTVAEVHRGILNAITLELSPVIDERSVPRGVQLRITDASQSHTVFIPSTGQWGIVSGRQVDSGFTTSFRTVFTIVASEPIQGSEWRVELGPMSVRPENTAEP